MEPKLQLLSPKGLIKTLNRRVVDSENELLLGKFQSERIKKDPLHDRPQGSFRDTLRYGYDLNGSWRGAFRYLLHGLVSDTKGRYLITRNSEGGLLDEFDLYRDINVSYIYLDAGRIDPSERGECGVYEHACFRFTRPIPLRKGITIPKCKIRLWTSQEGEFAKPKIKRTRQDLSSILPTEWFLSQALQTHLARTGQRAYVS